MHLKPVLNKHLLCFIMTSGFIIPLKCHSAKWPADVATAETVEHRGFTPLERPGSNSLPHIKGHFDTHVKRSLESNSWTAAACEGQQFFNYSCATPTPHVTLSSAPQVAVFACLPVFLPERLSLFFFLLGYP